MGYLLYLTVIGGFASPTFSLESGGQCCSPQSPSYYRGGGGDCSSASSHRSSSSARHRTWMRNRSTAAVQIWPVMDHAAEGSFGIPCHHLVTADHEQLSGYRAEAIGRRVLVQHHLHRRS